jgi:hypothetical protein
MANSPDLEKLLSDAKRIAKSRKLTGLVYLLELAAIEAAKAREILPRPSEELGPRAPFGRRGGR